MVRTIFFTTLITLFSAKSLFCNDLSSYLKVEDITPTTFEEVCSLEKEMIQKMQTQMKEFILCCQREDFIGAFANWNDFYRSFIVAKIQLEISSTIAKSSEAKRRSKEATTALQQVFLRIVRDSKTVRKQFIKIGNEHSHELSPLQREISFQILRRYIAEAKGLSQQECEEMLLAIEKLAPLEKHPFASYRSDSENVELSSKTKILNINTLCFPEMLSCYFGGMRPWEERVDAIADKILSTEAEVVCLQEVWDFKAAEALIDRLEEEYGYFFYDIGNANYLLNPNDLKVNSGLFVASKHPISHQRFVSFDIPGQHPKLNRGLFFFLVGDENENAFGVINTHLESGEGIRQAAIRRQSLIVANQFFEKFSADYGKNLPLFLTGDLNIDSTSPEYRSSNLENEYTNYFRLQSSTDPYTCTDFFEQLVFAPKKEENNIRPNFAAYDYFIERKNQISLQIQSEKIKMFDWKRPMEALSDHHGLLNIVDFSKFTMNEENRKERE